MTSKSLAQCLEWARGRTDPEGDIANAVITLRRYERATEFTYGRAEHEDLLSNAGVEHASDWSETWTSTWLASGADPADILGEMHWVETLYTRMARLPYRSPQHFNAMRYAEAQRESLFDKLGLAPLVRTEQE